MCGECWELTDKYQKALGEFERQYPNYCRRCGGQGEIEYSYDPSPAGVSLSLGRMWDAESCTECTEKGVCPLCAKPLDSLCGCPEDVHAPPPPDFECPQLVEQDRIYWREMEQGVRRERE